MYIYKFCVTVRKKNSESQKSYVSWICPTFRYVYIYIYIFVCVSMYYKNISSWHSLDRYKTKICSIWSLCFCNFVSQILSSFMSYRNNPETTRHFTNTISMFYWLCIPNFNFSVPLIATIKHHINFKQNLSKLRKFT